jgi:hypothetical protein
MPLGCSSTAAEWRAQTLLVLDGSCDPVAIQPGATVFAVMRCAASSTAKVLA